MIVPKAVYHEAIIGDKKEARQLRNYLKDKVRIIDMSQYIYLDGFANEKIELSTIY